MRFALGAKWGAFGVGGEVVVLRRLFCQHLLQTECAETGGETADICRLEIQV